MEEACKTWMKKRENKNLLWGDKASWCHPEPQNALPLGRLPVVLIVVVDTQRVATFVEEHGLGRNMSWKKNDGNPVSWCHTEIRGSGFGGSGITEFWHLV